MLKEQHFQEVYSEENCINCIYGLFDKSFIGECHRYAPRPEIGDRDIESDDAQSEAEKIGIEYGNKMRRSCVWPIVYEDDFCGEFVKGSSQEKDQAEATDQHLTDSTK